MTQRSLVERQPELGAVPAGTRPHAHGVSDKRRTRAASAEEAALRGFGRVDRRESGRAGVPDHVRFDERRDHRAGRSVDMHRDVRIALRGEEIHRTEISATGCSCSRTPIREKCRDADRVLVPLPPSCARPTYMVAGAIVGRWVSMWCLAKPADYVTGGDGDDHRCQQRPGEQARYQPDPAPILKSLRPRWMSHHPVVRRARAAVCGTTGALPNSSRR